MYSPYDSIPMLFIKIILKEKDSINPNDLIMREIEIFFKSLFLIGLRMKLINFRSKISLSVVLYM